MALLTYFHLNFAHEKLFSSIINIIVEGPSII